MSPSATKTDAPPDGRDSAWSPVGPEARYEAPRAGIDPDRQKSWLGRTRHIVMAHKGIFFTSLILAFAGLLIQVEIPSLVGSAIDNSLVSHENPLGQYVWMIMALALVRLVMGYFSRRYLYETAFAIEYDLRNIVYSHLSKMSFEFYDTVQSGQLISRANSDIRTVQMYLSFAPYILVQCAIAFVAFGKMLTINVPLAFLAMATTPMIFITAQRLRKHMFPVSWLIQSRLADVATVVDENVNGVRVVKAFAAEDRQLKTLAGEADRLMWANFREADIRGRAAPSIENMPRVGLALVLVCGGLLVINGHASVGMIAAFNSYILMMQPPFRQLGMIITLGQRASASAGRIFEILDTKSTVVDRPGAVDLTECKGDVRFDNVHFDYPTGTPVLTGLDLHLRPGETVAVVGRTGTGKSTIARLLNRSYDVTSGSVRIDGIDVRDVTLESLRARVGVVFDEPFLFSVSVRDNIAYGRPDAPFDEILAVAEAAGADGFIRELPKGYDTVVGERGYTLSGGQRQRIAIARTLLSNPPVLVLDDATSAIDVHVELRIHDALSKLMENRTTIIIAHRLSTIRLASRVVLLEGGRVVADGTHEELLRNEPRYGEVLAQVEEWEAEHDLDAEPQHTVPVPLDGASAGLDVAGLNDVSFS